MSKLNKADIEFKTAREVLIYEIAHVMGMMKREQEIQQEVFNYELMHDMKAQDASNGCRLRLHTDKWFDGMTDNINRCIAILKTIDKPIQLDLFDKG
jgi:hypothetical protein